MVEEGCGSIGARDLPLDVLHLTSTTCRATGYSPGIREDFRIHAALTQKLASLGVK